LPSDTKVDYAWDYPTAENKRIKLMIDGVPLPRTVDMMAIGIQPPMKIPVSLAIRRGHG
jgi:vacuolar protein sorting-associated protein 13A/C